MDLRGGSTHRFTYYEESMKILSLHQPWASLVAIGAKRYETRSWKTDYRGPIAIHAAKKWDATLCRLCHGEPFKDHLMKGGFRFPASGYGSPIFGRRQTLLSFGLPFGKVVSVADLV